MTERIPVAFEGDGAGTGHLTWGQLDLWLAMERLGTWFPLGYVRPLPEETTIEGVVSELRFMMNRYPTLRTRLRFGADDGLPRQVVSAAGELVLEVVDVADHHDPAQVAAGVQRRLEKAEFDFTTDWPVRSAVIRHRGLPTHQVMVMCHLASDAGGGRVIAADLAGRDPDTGRARNPPPVMQPLRLAERQGTPAARRQSLAAVRYAREVLRTMPPHRFGAPTDPRTPRYWQFGFTSRATYLALQAISTHTKVDFASALFTVYVIALARVSGVNPVVSRVLVGNRFRRELAEVVAPISQAGLVMVDVAGATFGEALTRVRHRAMGAYKYAYYDPRDMDGLEELVSRQRGQAIEVGCFFNDRRRPAATAAPPVAPSREKVLAALPETILRHELKQDDPLERLFLHVNHAPNTLDLTVLTDTHYASPRDVEALLRAMEEIAVDGAFDPSAPTGVPGPFGVAVGVPSAGPPAGPARSVPVRPTPGQP